MRNYFAFLKKELLESVGTYKLFILLTVFTLFGVMNPLIAKLTPTLIKKLIPAGTGIPIQEPAALDSWLQFFKNINQLGLIVIVLVFSSILVGEISKGTLINLLTKGLSRTAVILAKFTAMVLIWSLSILATFVVTWLYTIFLFPQGGVAHLFFAISCLWLYGVFLLALLLFASTLSNSTYGNLIIVGGTTVLCVVLNLVPKVQKFNPLSLSQKSGSLLTKAISLSELRMPIIVTLVLIIILINSAVLIFKRTQI